MTPPAGRTVRVSPTRFYLVLDDVDCGLLASATGGAATADVRRDSGAQLFVPKHLGAARYEPITISFGLSLHPTVYEWIAAWWGGKHVRKRGVIRALGPSQKVISELAFDHASIARTELPPLDAASKDPCLISLSIVPRRTVSSKGTGQAKVAVSKQKAWRAASFRLEIDGLDCSRVSKVSSLTVPGTAPTDFPSIEVGLSTVGSESWFDWHESFVVNGQNDDSHERSGELVYLAPDGKRELGRVKLRNLGIYRIAPEPQQPNGGLTGSTSRLVVSLYCERMELDLAAVP